ncbi:FkbM family methyltransferase [Hyphomonas atlantica]|uniref:FkbM family methyltransferase n=1 Tax=Hyphomonas atlantica TaxID=1280948 RepID=UPI0023F24389|nr:FkbM family methyltransferase [Hyphomonas atlantica]
MKLPEWSTEFANRGITEAWSSKGYASLPELRDWFPSLQSKSDQSGEVLRAVRAFNGNDLSVGRIREFAASGDKDAQSLLGLITRDPAISSPPYSKLAGEEFHRLRALIKEDPSVVHSGTALEAYPYYIPGRTYGYDIAWVREMLGISAQRLEEMKAARTRDVAVLVGNGPSLNKTDLSLLEDQDVFISNYAIKHQDLSRYAKGVAVTNYLVAEQEPYQFMLRDDVWKFFPFWLRNTIIPDDKTIMLDAQGGDLFFSEDITKRIAWHSTVSFFWLQILYHLGYKKVLMIGFDNSYNQAKSSKEGDMIKQEQDDPNHFDPSYFKGKTWQAADTSKMEETYVISRDFYAANGRELVNCTVGGALEVLRRGDLAEELKTPVRSAQKAKPSPRRARKKGSPKIAIITPFWKGDVAMAERHWRIVRRIGGRPEDHIHLFKHARADLPPVTFENVICADIDKAYPRESKLPHPAGPNLTFVHTVKLLAESDYTHFFWLEPDCVPTQADWLDAFIDAAENNPDAPIVGVGGGAISPTVPHWKHHFAGCSLYNVQALAKVDWARFLEKELDVSFDVWLSRELGYIKLLDVDDEDQKDTIIFGAHRYKWELIERPKSVVTGMFEHWRPQKFLSAEQLQSFVDSGSFSLFHAIKDEKLQRRIHANAPKSASTIIINYNNEKFLKEAIESSLDQHDIDDIDYEVIVVDDGSTDGSLDIIDSFGERIRAIKLEHGRLNGNFNQQRALMHAIKQAEGDVILLLDGDDVCRPGRVSKVVQTFGNPDVVLVQHALETISEGGAPIGNTRPLQQTTIQRPWDYLERQRANFYQPTSGLAFRRSYIELCSSLFLGFDRFHRTWLDVRLTRFAPFFGKTVALWGTWAAWRRHGASDSIERDNIRSRLMEHHDWVNDAGRRFGFCLGYRGGQNELKVRQEDVLIPIDTSPFIHLSRKDDDVALSVHDRESINSVNGVFRQRVAALLPENFSAPDGFVEVVEDCDLILPVENLERLETEMFQHGSYRRVFADGDGTSNGWAFIVCADKQQLTAERIRKASGRLGRKVVAIVPDEPDQESTSLAIVANALGYRTLFPVGQGRNWKQAITEATNMMSVDMSHAGKHIASLSAALAIQGYADQVSVNGMGAFNTSQLMLPPPPKLKPVLPRDAHAGVDETEVVAKLLSELKGRDHVMLDVGAHFGTSAKFFDRLGWTIHCFEPDPDNRKKLTAQFGDASNVSVDTRAVSDVAGETLPFYQSQESTGISGLNKFRDTHVKALNVKTTTVEEIVREKGLNRIDFLKIDVEGFDFSVLKGVPWDTLKPDVIECEYEDAKTISMGHNWHDIAKYLIDRGYAVYVSEWHPIIRYGVAHDWKTVVPYAQSETVHKDSWGNLLAFRKDPGYDAVRKAFDGLLKRRAPPVNPSPATSLPASKPASALKRLPTPTAAVKRPFYADAAEHLAKRSPRAFAALRFLRRGVLGVVRRKWMLAAIGALGLLVLLTVIPQTGLSALRPWVLGGAAFAVAMLSVLYLALRVYQYINVLSLEIRTLRQSIEYLKNAQKVDKSRSENLRGQSDLLKKEVKRLKADHNSMGGVLQTTLSRVTEADQKLTSDMKRVAAETAEKIRIVDSALTQRVESTEKAVSQRLDDVQQAVSKRLDDDQKTVSKRLDGVQQAVLKDLGRLESMLADAGKTSDAFVQKADTRFKRVESRVAAGERQIGEIKYPDAPQTMVLFGHHKCASRYFRDEIFARIAEMTDARVRRYHIDKPPFHHSRMDELDLSNIDFTDLGKTGKDVVMLANATKRSLSKIKKATDDWKGLRIIRDPRQVLVSNYFHHKGDHNTEYAGWVWDKLVTDKPILRELPEEEGLIYELDNISKEVIETQILAPMEDDRILTFKLEEFEEDRLAHLKQAAQFLGIADIAGIALGKRGASDTNNFWQAHFTTKIRDMFKERYGQALIDLGYAEDMDW